MEEADFHIPSLRTASSKQERASSPYRFFPCCEPVANPEIIRRLDDLGFSSPAAPIDEFRAIELMVGVKLEQEFAGRALRRGLRWREADAHRRIVAHTATGESLRCTQKPHGRNRATGFSFAARAS